MISLRIGCDRIIRWSITSGGEHYDLTGRNIRLKVSTRSTQFFVSPDDFSIDGNKIVWLFRGKDQKYLGPYSLTYIENEGMDDMLTFDMCDIFNLVAWSCMENQSLSEDLEISNFDIASDIEALGVKLLPLSLITPVGNGQGDNSAVLKNSNSIASGPFSTALGYNVKAEGDYSIAEGCGTTAKNLAEHASGKYNSSHDDTQFSIGIGTSDTDRKNAIEAKENGAVYVIGIGEYDGTNPTSATDLAALLKSSITESELDELFND